MNPRYVRREDVTAADLNGRKEIYKEQARASGKPEHIIEKITEGKLKDRTIKRLASTTNRS